MSDSKRKLAAIVFTDIVGFTNLTSKNQQKASDLLDIQRNLLKPLVESYSGKWVKEMGDGLILTFDTINNAVECCLNIQEKSKEIDNLVLRIGIHLGEILEKENDIIGDDVNITARIEPFSAPGGIAISNKINDAIIREDGFDTKYLGKPKLKGVGQEVKVYCITSHGLPETILSNVSAKLEPEGFQWNFYSLSGAVLTLLGILFWINLSFIGIGIADEVEVPSIAVLPFTNKGAAEDEFFSYGISADLISELASAGLIRVESLANIEKIPDYEDLKAEKLASKLFVRYIVEGTLWKKDNIFQLSVELYDTKENKTVWTNRWQEDWAEVSKIKDNIAHEILKNFENKTSDKKILRNIDPYAYELFLKARYKIRNLKSSGDEQIAIDLFNKAIEVDSSFLMAKVYLGNTYIKPGDHNTWDKANDIYLDVLKRARLVGNRKAEAASLFGLANVLWFKSYNDISLLDEASKTLEKVDIIHNEQNKISEKINVNLFRGGIHGRKEEYSEAIDYTNKALEIAKKLESKNSIASCLSQLSDMYRSMGDYKKVEDLLKETMEIDKILDNKKALGHTYNSFGSLYFLMARYDEALDFEQKQLDICLELGDVHRSGRVYDKIGVIYYALGNYEEGYKFQNKSLLVRQKMNDDNGLLENYYRMSSLQYALGNLDSALNYILKSEEIQKKDGVMKYWRLHTIVMKNLILKKQGKPIDNNELGLLYEEGIRYAYMSLSGELEYSLFQLTNDSNYLKLAYDELINSSEHLESPEKEIFFDRPIQKGILNEYNEIFPKNS